MESTAGAFEELIGEDLSAVTFVRDYLQLQFNPPPALNAMTPVTVWCEGKSSTLGDTSFPLMIVGQIDKVVQDVRYQEGHALELVFEDGSIIAISLLPQDYRGAEAINLLGRAGLWVAE